MWGNIIGGLISAGSAIAGTVMSNKSQKAANNSNYAAQKEFAQNSIAWRKQDALNSGINPIYALGHNGASFSPSYQGSTFDYGGDSVQSGISAGTQARLYKKQLAQQQQYQEKVFESMELENDIKRIQRNSLLRDYLNDLKNMGQNSAQMSGIKGGSAKPSSDLFQNFRDPSGYQDLLPANSDQPMSEHRAESPWTSEIGKILSEHGERKLQPFVKYIGNIMQARPNAREVYLRDLQRFRPPPKGDSKTPTEIYRYILSLPKGEQKQQMLHDFWKYYGKPAKFMKMVW